MINKTLAILAGGKSSRMNCENKAFLSYRRKTFIEHIIKAGASFEEIIIVANDRKLYESFKIPVVEDIFKNSGPLAGVHSALENSNKGYVLCVACDMPFIKPEVLEFMGNYKGDYDILIPKCKDRFQPLCAIYSQNIKGKLEESLLSDKNKLQRFVLSVNYKIVSGIGYREFDEKDFLNVNTPIDYKNLEDI